MKTQKALIIKDFFSADGALHAGEKIIIESESSNHYRVQSDMGRLFVIPKHIIKIIA